MSALLYTSTSKYIYIYVYMCVCVCSVDNIYIIITKLRRLVHATLFVSTLFRLDFSEIAKCTVCLPEAENDVQREVCPSVSG